MTTEEAIKQLEYDKAMCLFNPMTGEEEPMNEDCRKSAEADELAIEALKKQIPMKPIVTLPNWKKGIPFSVDCPTCGNYLTTKVKRCEECGQLIDWSDYETD